MTVPGAPHTFLECEVISFQGDECLTWPFAKHVNGYGKIVVNKKQKTVSRLVCEIIHGQKPTEKHEAAHSCGNGHLGCVNPNHLSWKTPKENQADRILHGTSNRGSRHGRAILNEIQVLQIYDLKRSYSHELIAAVFGVDKRRVDRISCGADWGWLTSQEV